MAITSATSEYMAAFPSTDEVATFRFLLNGEKYNDGGRRTYTGARVHTAVLGLLIGYPKHRADPRVHAAVGGIHECPGLWAMANTSLGSLMLDP